MKKKHSVISVLLVIVLLLTGCDVEYASTTGSNTTQNTTSDSGGVTESLPRPTEPESIINIQYLPEKVNNPDSLPVLKWVCLTERIYGGGKRTWSEAAVHDVNQMLADKALPFRIQFVMVTMEQWLPYSDWFSRLEAQTVLADADLIYGVMSTSQMQEYLTPITEYVNGNKQPSLANSVPHKMNWFATTIDSEIYGIYTRPAKALSKGWVVNAAFAEKNNLTEEMLSGNFWEMDDVFAKLYRENENKPFLYINEDSIVVSSNTVTDDLDSLSPGSVSSMIPNYYQQIGSCFAIDYSTSIPKVINVLETDVVHNIRQAVKRYIEAGYVTRSTQTAQIAYGYTMGTTAYKDWKQDLCVPVTVSVCEASSRWGYISGISSTSENKEEAVAFLNLIAEDESFRKQLFYGKENRDYIISNGYYTLLTQDNGADYSLSMISPLSFFCGLTANRETAGLVSPGTQNWDWIESESKTKLQIYQDNMDDCTVRYLPITFDYSEYEKEIENIGTILKKYFSKYTGQAETEHEKMLQEIKNVGSDQILVELQQQLDAWIKENPASYIP